MRTLLRTAGLLLVVLGSPAAEATELFHLIVDPDGTTPFSDVTGRHGIATGGVADVDPGAPVVPGSVVATSVLSPGGGNAALLTGGWLEITTSNPSYASDFLFAPNQNLTVTFWFRSAGNGLYEPTPALGHYSDRMHSLGFGSATNNLDVDFGDDDPVSSLPETACWTYFGSGGENNIIDSDSTHSRTYYLDDQWHFYRLVRDANVVTVYLDGQTLGTAAYADSLGSDSPSAHQFIGRASVRHDLPHIEDPFPWFGYIGDVRVFDQAVPPEEFATNEHYACYQAKAADAGLKPDPKPSGTLTNQVANGTFEKCKFKLICVPTEKNDSGPPGNPALNYCGWQCKGFKGEVPFTVSDQFGSGAVVAKKLKFILNECTVSP